MEFKAPALLTDDEIAEVILKANELSKWADGVYAFAQDQAIIHGKQWNGFKVVEGRSNRTGVLSSTGGADLGVTAAKADALTFDGVMDLFYSLRAPYRRNPVFMLNDSTVKALRKLKNGNGDYIWQPSVIAGTPDTILSRPVHTSSYMPELGADTKPILFGDLSYYWIADREGRTFKRLNELFAPTGQVGFLASQRVDGKLILPEAAKVLQMKPV